MLTSNVFFDPDTLAMLKGTLERAIAGLPSEERESPQVISDLASNILAVAGGGERDSQIIERRALRMPRAKANGFSDAL